MRYGHFDDAAREYVITRPDTPRSWSNYLGSRLYGGIVTQNGGGYSFFRSGGTGRLLRMRFNGVPQDEPGRFVYLRDDATGDYWSATWQPVGKPLDGPDAYRAQVRHGLGYSIFEASYAGIDSELTMFVPQDQAFEHWALTITNPGPAPRTLSVFSYAELANEWNYRQDLENLQYSQYVVQASYRDGFIHRRNSTRDAFSECWFALTGAEVASFDTDRDVFLGPYRTQSAPLAVERGECSGSETVGDNACASLHARLELAVPVGDLRQEPLALAQKRPVLQLDGAQLEDALDALHHVLVVEGLQDVVGGARLHELDGDLLAPLPGEHDHVGFREAPPDLLESGEAVHVRHHVVEQDQLGALALDGFQPVPGVQGGEDLVTAVLEDYGGKVQDDLLVVYDQHAAARLFLNSGGHGALPWVAACSWCIRQKKGAAKRRPTGLLLQAPLQGSLTVTTGQSALRTTLSAVEPNSRWSMPLLPWVPSTMKETFSLSARFRISS